MDELDGTTPVERFRALNEELRAYDDDLLRRPQVVVLTKTDLLDPDEVEARRAAFEAQIGTRVLAASSVTGDGITPVVGAAWSLVAARKKAEAVEEDDQE